MDGQRPGSMTDAMLDRELESAFAVEPSPEFLTRVRSRVAAETVRAHAAPVWWWPVWASAAAAVMVAVTVTVWNLGEGGRRETVLAGSMAIAPSTTLAPVLPVQSRPGISLLGQDGGRQSSEPVRPIVRVKAASRALEQVADSAVTDRPPFTEVLISQDEVRALRRLLGLAPADAQRSPDVAAASAEPLEMEGIEIAPVFIEPLPQLARLQPGELP